MKNIKPLIQTGKQLVEDLRNSVDCCRVQSLFGEVERRLEAAEMLEKAHDLALESVRFMREPEWRELLGITIGDNLFTDGIAKLKSRLSFYLMESESLELRVHRLEAQLATARAAADENAVLFNDARAAADENDKRWKERVRHLEECLDFARGIAEEDTVRINAATDRARAAEWRVNELVERVDRLGKTVTRLQRELDASQS